MTSWIDYAQRFVASGFKDQSAWEAAQASCQNLRIRKFLNDWPVMSEEAAGRAGSLVASLVADKQVVPALMVRYLTFVLNFLSLQTPLKIPRDQLDSRFSAARVLSEQLDGHQELRPSACFLHYVCGVGLHVLGEYEAARADYERTRDIYRKLSEEQPAVYQFNLAMAQYGFGNMLRDARDFPAARIAYEEARDIYRKLAEEQPEINLPNLGMCLNNLGVVLQDARDFRTARATFEEALIIRRQLAAKQPTVYLHDVGMTLNNYGNQLCDARDFPAARTAHDEALVIFRQLAKNNRRTTYLI